MPPYEAARAALWIQGRLFFMGMAVPIIIYSLKEQ